MGLKVSLGSDPTIGDGNTVSRNRSRRQESGSDPIIGDGNSYPRIAAMNWSGCSDPTIGDGSIALFANSSWVSVW